MMMYVTLFISLLCFQQQSVIGLKINNNRYSLITSSTTKLLAASQVIAAQPSVEEWLSVCEPGLKKTCLAMFYSYKEIAYKIRTASCDKMACFNEFGDEQLAIDILANNVIFQNLKACGAVATASSEETPTEGAIVCITTSYNI